MNKTLIAAAASVFILAGCSSEPEEAAVSEMDQLTNQVAELSSEVEALKRDKAAAEMKAQEASAGAQRRPEEDGGGQADRNCTAGLHPRPQPSTHILHRRRSSEPDSA